MNIVIRRFVTIYGEPKTPNPSEFRAEYERALASYTEATLNRAVDTVVQEFRPFANQPWPAISDVIKAARKACEGTAADAKTEMDKIRFRVRKVNHQAKVSAAFWLERSPLGRQALLEGWARELWEWVTQVIANAQLEGRQLDQDAIRFDPERIAYAREHCQSGRLEHLDLWLIFGTEAKAIEWLKRRHGPDYQPRPPIKLQPRAKPAKLDWSRAGDGAFQRMQTTSKNRELHQGIAARITGERE